MLDYLVASRTRRELLKRLWVEGRVASVSELARASDVSFAAAHRELEAMKSVGLAVAEREGVATLYRADRRHPGASVLASLLAPPAPAGGQEAEELESRLCVHPVEEETIAEGLTLSHRSPSVARALVVALWRQRDELDLRHLRRAAAQWDERQALGFFLQLAGRLGGDRRLALLGSTLRDHRRTVKRPFFVDGTASARSSPLALSWGYLLDIDGAGFTKAFRRHAPGRVIRSSIP